MTTEVRVSGEYGINKIDYTQDGTGAVRRNGIDKLKETVSVKDFGAVGDGVADDTAAIQAAIDSIPAGGVVHFPDGDFKITLPLIIRYSAITLQGSGRNSTRIYSYGEAVDGIQIRTNNWNTGTGVYISTVVLRDFNIFKKTSSTDGYGVIETLGSGTFISNVGIYDFPYGLKKEGCVNSASEYLFIQQGTSITNTASNSYGVCITSATLASGTVTVGFTHRFVEPFITSSNNDMDFGVIVEHGDVITFSGGYIGRQVIGAITTRRRAGLTTGYAKAVKFRGTYFDGVNINEDRIGVFLKEDTGFTISAMVFYDCTWGQYETAFQCTNILTKGLVIDGQMFWCKRHAIYLQDTQQARINITGYSLNTSGTGTGTINATDCGVLEISCNLISGYPGLPAIRLSGTCTTLNIHDVVLDSTFPTTSISYDPDKVTNLSGTPQIILFTPTLNFAGDSTGITYSTRQGYYSIANGIVTFSVYIVLSSKGSAVGDARIPLPVLKNASIISGPVVSANISGTAGTETSNHVFALVGGTYLQPRYGTGTGTLIFSNTNLTDTSTLIISGSYPM